MRNRESWFGVGGKSILLLALAVGATGCTTGPHWRVGVAIPAPNEPIAQRQLIVTNFVTAERVVSVTQSQNIQTILESAHVSDISPEIASALAEAGLRAEARAGFTVEKLQPDQLLVHGAVLAVDGYDTMGKWMIPYCASIGLCGLWLPSPFTYDKGYNFLYRIEVIDHQGRYLLATSTREGRIVFEERHLIRSGAERDLFREMRRRVTEVLAQSIRTGQPATFGPMAKQ